MAVGAQADDAFLLEEVVRKLKLIKRPDYWTDVADVDLPGYEEDNVAEVFKGETPLIHVWWQMDVFGGGMEDSAKFRPIFRVMVMGVIKAGRGLQLAMIGIKNDIRNVMMSNSWVPVGRYTRPSPGFPAVAFYHEGTGSEGMGSVKTMWDIEYNAPYPKS